MRNAAPARFTENEIVLHGAARVPHVPRVRAGRRDEDARRVVGDDVGARDVGRVLAAAVGRCSSRRPRGCPCRSLRRRPSPGRSDPERGVLTAGHRERDGYESERGKRAGESEADAHDCAWSHRSIARKLRALLAWLGCRACLGIVGGEDERQRHEAGPQRRQVEEHGGPAVAREEEAGDGRTDQHSRCICRVIEGIRAAELGPRRDHALQREADRRYRSERRAGHEDRCAHERK